MKKNIFFVLVIIGLLIKPAIACASFFDDGRWYMDSSWWDELGAWTDPGDRISVVDDTDRLNLTTPAWPTGWTDGYDANDGYVSKWKFDLDYDFEFSTGFHLNHAETFEEDAGISGGVVYLKDGDPYSASVSASNFVAEYDGSRWTRDVLRGEFWLHTGESEKIWDRTGTDGKLLLSYNSDSDILHLEAFNKSGGTFTSAGFTEYENFRTATGLSELAVVLDGYSCGAGLVGSEAYLHNFQVVKGTMTPEPVSCVLFLVGTGVLALARKKNKKNKFTIPAS